MSRAQKALLWLTASLALASGLVYAWMRYLMHGDDPFSAYNHPAQPWLLDTHVLVAPLLVFAVGWFWGTHVMPRLRRGEAAARQSGLWLLGLAATMTLTGYLVQTAGDPWWRAAAGWTHGISGTVFFLVLVGHLLTGRRRAGLRDDGSRPFSMVRERRASR